MLSLHCVTIINMKLIRGEILQVTCGQTNEVWIKHLDSYASLYYYYQN
jgi:hypothetical protein